MARIPKRLSGPAKVAILTTTKYTVPSTTKTIVRHIHVQNPSTASVSFTFSIGTDNAGNRVFDDYAMGPRAVLDHFCYYVLEAGESLQASAGTDNVLVMTIDGDEYILG